jgi:hypothetical protein
MLNELLLEDLDSEDVVIVDDPESDRIPHLVMQLKKALDTDGNHDIVFKDGSKHQLPLDSIALFLTKYMDLKPTDKEQMQQVGSESKENFDLIVQQFGGQKAPKSIY